MAVENIASVKVARIVSEREVAFNRGSNSGIRDGDNVTISDRIEITDPDTKEVLGHVLVPKLRLMVTLAAEKYCIAKVTDRSSSANSSKSGRIAGLPGPLKKVTDSIFEESSSTVLVEAGQPAAVRRSSPDEEENSF